ncbi:MAG: glycosyltransferase [Prevotella sp.]|nr:glycosyltransferase [Prevotella sp.]
MEKKKLLIFHPTLAPYRIDFFNRLQSEFEVRLCFSFKFSIFKNYEKLEEKLAFRPIYMKSKPNHNTSLVSEYIKQIKDYDPDIVLTSEYDKGTIVTILNRWLKRKQYKIVSICDDSYDMVSKNKDFSFRHTLTRKTFAWFVDNIILVEPRVVDWYKKKFHKGIWMPIIRDDKSLRIKYEELLPASRDLVKEHHLENKHVFLFVGRLSKEKNIETILSSFSKLAPKDNVLVIIGSGQEEAKLKKQAAALNNVIFTGRLEGDNLYAWYNVASCFILASTQEAFGAVTNEALIAGCWTLVSEKAGSQCLIKSGVNGDVFNPLKPEELVEKMKDAFSKTMAVKNPLPLKENKMVVDFEDCMDRVIHEIMLL